MAANISAHKAKGNANPNDPGGTSPGDHADILLGQPPPLTMVPGT